MTTITLTPAMSSRDYLQTEERLIAEIRKHVSNGATVHVSLSSPKLADVAPAGSLQAAASAAEPDELEGVRDQCRQFIADLDRSERLLQEMRTDVLRSRDQLHRLTSRDQRLVEAHIVLWTRALSDSPLPQLQRLLSLLRDRSLPTSSDRPLYEPR
ncbi:MAG: hypothetical protein JWM31_1506 [Solirubrobacterales bacterium]|nr:hypothetical protein [Solirubrobacterales bacterium]